MFESQSLPEARSIALLKKAFVVTIGALLVTGAISSYRAYVQVKSLEVMAEQELTPGSNVRATVVGSGRTMVDVKVELIQGGYSETLMSMYLPGNDLAFFDPRSQSTENQVQITADRLSRFQPGPALIRAVAVGRHQWMRLPPPTVREIQVTIGTNNH
jgi:hypothetical protein